MVTEIKSVMKQFKKMNEIFMNFEIQQRIMKAIDRINKRARKTSRRSLFFLSSSTSRRRRRRRRYISFLLLEFLTKTARTLSTSQQNVLVFRSSIQRFFNFIGFFMKEIDIVIVFFN